MAKEKARCFGQDLMRGEHVVGTRSVKKIAGVDVGQSEDVRGGLTHRTTTDPYRAKNNSSVRPGGGGNDAGRSFSDKYTGGDCWAGRKSIPAGLTHGEVPNYDGSERTITGTSIFDPVLCEIAYRWFSPLGGVVIDPFAGGSVRGIVASMLGRRYIGVDLRPEQIEANRAQAEKICAQQDFPPEWIVGDSKEVVPLIDEQADLIFSCPPYGDLEVYSDLDADISNMPHKEFLDAYRAIIAASVDRLKDDRFACFVVGDYRDSKGLYRNFPGETIAAFEAAGARLYNYAILITAAGSLPIRAGKQFSATRKLGKTHQDVLVFVKGDPRKATEALGDVEFGDVGAEERSEEAPLEDEFGELL